MNGVFTKHKSGWITGNSGARIRIYHKTNFDKYKPISERVPVILGSINDSKVVNLHIDYVQSGYFYGVNISTIDNTTMENRWQIMYIING